MHKLYILFKIKDDKNLCFFYDENIIFGKIINKNEFIRNEVLILKDELYINIIFIKNGNLVSV